MEAAEWVGDGKLLAVIGLAFGSEEKWLSKVETYILLAFNFCISKKRRRARSHFILQESVPRTSNGKVKRRKGPDRQKIMLFRFRFSKDQ